MPLPGTKLAHCGARVDAACAVRVQSALVPIVDVEIIAPAANAAPNTRALADALGSVFATPPGSTWVRLRSLDATAYAENHAELSNDGLPVFVTVLHAHLPARDALIAELRAVTRAVAAWAGRPAENVHVQYAPAAAGRQAFGGGLIE